MNSLARRITRLLFVLCLITGNLCAEQRIYEAKGYYGAVSCGHPLAAEAAINVLKNGGNAVDAAITLSLVLGVVDFTNSGLGGEAFALIHEPSGRIIAFDASTKRPTSNIRFEYDCPIALPAIPELICKFHRFYASKPMSELAQPALDFCENGFNVSPYLANIIEDRFKRFTDKAALELIAPNGTPIKANQLLKQPKLAKTIKQLSSDNGLSFYFGNDADATIADIAIKGGHYTKYDFMKYKSRLCMPVVLSYKDYAIYGHPLPSCSPLAIKLAMELLSTDRPMVNQTLPEFFVQNKIYRKYLNIKYLEYSKFHDNSKAFFSYDPTEKQNNTVESESSNTTHFCIWDKNNMIVSMTQTVGNHFGTCQLAPGGYFYANSLRNYSSRVVRYSDDYPHNFGPITSKSPIIVKKHGSPWLALGGAGADRIVTNVATILAKQLRGQRLSDSINSFRSYPDYEGKIFTEAITEPINDNTYARQYRSNSKLETTNLTAIEPRPYLADFFGLVSAIKKQNDASPLEAVGDRHRDGSCAAY